ncbi:MAG: hypothetical protein AAF761_10730, partial [Pseudomonadota bacterium]
MTTRRAFMAGLLATAALPACAGAPTTSPRPVARPLRGAAKIKAAHTSVPLRQIIADAGISGAHSILVADAATGTVIEGYGARKAPSPPLSRSPVGALWPV